MTALPGPEFAIRHPLDVRRLHHPVTITPSGATVVTLDQDEDPVNRVRVICAAPTRAGGLRCRQQLGTVIEEWPGSPLARLYMPEGFREGKDGLWQVSAHALTRFRTHRVPRDRRPSPLDDPMFRQRQPERWPFPALCPKCNQRRTFNAAVLGLNPIALQRFRSA